MFGQLTHEWERLKECEEENGEDGAPCSFLAGLLEEIKQDMPCLRLMVIYCTHLIVKFLNR